MTTFDHILGCEVCNRLAKDPTEISFDFVMSFYESSHYDLSLHRCKKCKTFYLHSFEELVDFEEGNDLMWSKWMALTDIEVNEILSDRHDGKFEPGDLNKIAALIGIRRMLVLLPDRRIIWKEPNGPSMN